MASITVAQPATLMPSRAAAERVPAGPASERVTPEVVADARRLLGARLAATRKAVGVTQVQLALKVQWSRSTVANVETARQLAPREFWVACDVALGAGGLLVAAWAATEALSRRLRDQTAVELIRQRMSQPPPVCVCRDLQRLLDESGASSFLGIAPAAPAERNGAAGHG